VAKGSTAEERSRQAEIDAARTREIAEEEASRRDRIGSRQLASLSSALGHQVTARVIREYVRAVMIEPVVKRIYDIGMGVETFDVPTMAGNTVTVPASASVQVKALSALIQVGVPSQIGLVDDDGQVLPGVVALGELDMRSVQTTEHAARLGAAARVFGAEPAERSDNPAATFSPAMEQRVAAGEFEVVEIEEGHGVVAASPDVAPPPVNESEMTLEQKILAKRRAKRAQVNGHPNGR
jgi:hypothetical protein